MSDSVDDIRTYWQLDGLRQRLIDDHYIYEPVTVYNLMELIAKDVGTLGREIDQLRHTTGCIYLTRDHDAYCLWSIEPTFNSLTGMWDTPLGFLIQTGLLGDTADVEVALRVGVKSVEVGEIYKIPLGEPEKLVRKVT